MKKVGGKVFLSMLLAATFSMSGLTSWADTDLKFDSWVKELAISGDYRLRYDNEHFRLPAANGLTVNPGNKGADDRGRFRMRLRLGMDFTLPSKVKIKTRLDSGTGESVSPNQSFGNLNTEKSIWIGRAYLEWQPTDMFRFAAGKMPNPLWTQYSTDAIFDGDVNPEGAGENLNFMAGQHANLFFNAMQMVASEIKNSVHDNYLFVEQVGGEFRLPLESRFKLAYAYYDWRDMDSNAATSANIAQNPIQEGNRRNTATGVLLSKFGVNELSMSLSSWIGRLPIEFEGTFLKNSRAGIPANSPAALKPGEKQNTGYQVGTIVGKAKTAGTWEVAYFYKYLASDATIADQADSDFGDGGTNRRGHIMWAAYSATDWLTFQTKYFQTQNIDKTVAGTNNLSKGTIDRIQIDAVVKF